MYKSDEVKSLRAIQRSMLRLCFSEHIYITGLELVRCARVVIGLHRTRDDTNCDGSANFLKNDYIHKAILHLNFLYI